MDQDNNGRRNFLKTGGAAAALLLAPGALLARSLESATPADHAVPTADLPANALPGAQAIHLWVIDKRL